MKKLYLLLALLIPMQAFTQSDTVALRRNTVKLDITSRWLYRQAYVISYERVINPRRTMGLIIGYQTLPEVRFFGDNITVNRDIRAAGFKLGAEYRFYLARENKYAAPRGVYLGPYLSFNNFHNEREITVDNAGTPEYATLTSNINVLNVGVQLGYQFVFNDRWTLDFSFLGPALSNYNASLDLAGTYNFDPDNISSEILEDLVTRFPALGDLLGGSTVTSNGRMNTWAAGFRYQLLVGYRFGKRK